MGEVELKAVGAGNTITGGPGLGQAQSVPSPRLAKAAHEFEGQMMQELLKPMQQNDGLTGSDEDAGDGLSAGSGGALGDFASESLGKALSERGGFGIADSIMRQLLRGNHGA